MLPQVLESITDTASESLKDTFASVNSGHDRIQNAITKATVCFLQIVMQCFLGLLHDIIQVKEIFQVCTCLIRHFPGVKDCLEHHSVEFSTLVDQFRIYLEYAAVHIPALSPSE